jgi:signal transduction histidine kinase
VALLLVASIGGGTYVIIARYFEDVVDLALQHKMTHEFHLLAAPIPAELAFADRDWSLIRNELSPLGRGSQNAGPISAAQAIERAQSVMGARTVERVKQSNEDGVLLYEVRFEDGGEVIVDAATGRVRATKREDHEELVEVPASQEISTAAYDAELAAIFVLPLSSSGQILFDPNLAAPAPIQPNQAALQAALQNGSDVRTTISASGERIRLLTYRLTRDDGPAALQLGRVQTDQQLILNQLLMGLLVIGGFGVGLLGIGSWWLAGRSIQPMQQAWARQQQFVASASHELRTPLTLIRASAEVALRGIYAEQQDQRELLTDVVQEADHMRRLVDDLLTLSRLDTHQMPMQRQRVVIGTLLEDMRRQAERLANETPIVIAISTDNVDVIADRARLRQVLLILLDNALRYTPKDGQITLSSTRQGRIVQIKVSDTGSGIAPEHLPHIFDHFYRADQTRGVSNNSGLGLAIARGLIEAMGGQIMASSVLHRGTVVTLTLPVATHNQQLEPIESADQVDQPQRLG